MKAEFFFDDDPDNCGITALMKLQGRHLIPKKGILKAQARPASKGTSAVVIFDENDLQQISEFLLKECPKPPRMLGV